MLKIKVITRWFEVKTEFAEILEVPKERSKSLFENELTMLKQQQQNKTTKRITIVYKTQHTKFKTKKRLHNSSV